MWTKDRELTPGEKEFHLTGLHENPDAMRVLGEPLSAAAPEWEPER